MSLRQLWIGTNIGSGGRTHNRPRNPPTRRCTLHIRRGGSVFHLQKVLGYSTLEMTPQYTNLATADLQAVHERILLIMVVIDLFSKRQKQPRKEAPDVYQYDDIPQPLRVQVVHILRDVFGFPQSYDMNGCRATFKEIHALLSREYGVFQLTPKSFETDDAKVMDFILARATPVQVLDTIEISFRFAAIRVNSNYWGPQIPQKVVDDTIAELNIRFKEHSVSYQYESGELIRVDSQLIHAEVVKPVLALLADKEYAGVNAEFLKAYEHYRKGDTKECLNECLKAFESTMKAICTKRKWAFKPTDTASALIDVCLKNNLIPQMIQSHVGGVRAALESGIPTVRNKLSGHGQGTQVIEIPPHYASYMLHLTATTIKFFVESEKALN
jgi:hypothetical protein